MEASNSSMLWSVSVPVHTLTIIALVFALVFTPTENTPMKVNWHEWEQNHQGTSLNTSQGVKGFQCH